MVEIHEDQSYWCFFVISEGLSSFLKSSRLQSREEGREAVTHNEILDWNANS